MALTGRVVDQFDGRGVAGLTVRFAGATTTTDANGGFSIPGNPSSSLRDLSLSGPLQLGLSRRVRWGFELGARAPLEGGGAVATDISDCGTRGKAVKAGLRIGASLSRTVNVNCGYSRSVWGEDATLSQGISCGFSKSWE